MRTIVVYPGRFHPFHRGHKASYDYLTKRYGADNVFIVSSDKQDPETSPFSFADKLDMMTKLGISPKYIAQVRNPYQAAEIKNEIDDPENTVLIFAVSEKDMSGKDARFNFKPKKDGSAGYMQPLPEDGKGMQNMTKHAYVAVTPTVNFRVQGADANSASQIRKKYIAGNDADREQIIADLYGDMDSGIKDIFDRKLGTGTPVQTVSYGQEQIFAGDKHLNESRENVVQLSIASQLVECVRGSWELIEDHGRIQFVRSSIFNDTVDKKARQAPGLVSKLQDFITAKTVDPLQPFNAKDKPFPGDGPIGRAMPKLRYVHLTHDIILFYSMEGRDPITVKLYGVFSHDDIGIGMPRNINKQKSLLSRLKTAEDISHITEYAVTPDRDDDNNEVPDLLHQLANRWWNATDQQPQIESVLNSMGWSIQQVESKDDAVQLQHQDGTVYFISADEFDPDLFENPDYIEEKWSQKYKASINCSNPQGFSQRAHCAGRKKKKVNESSGYSLRGSFTPDLIESKVWLLKELGAVAPEIDTVYILGSWYGNLALYMHLQPTVKYDQIINVETDQAMLDQSARMLDHVGVDRVEHMLKDANELDYRQLGENSAVINTSLTDMPGRAWFDNIPAGTLVVLQARDQDPGEQFHGTEDIVDKFPLSQVYYTGTRSLQDPETPYNRFMVIGRK